MFSFSMLFLNELVKTTNNSLRGKEKYSLAEKKELGELVEKCKKEYDKEVKAICHFSVQKVSTQTN